MTKKAITSLSFILLLAAASTSFAQSSPQDAAVQEAVKRQAAQIELRQILANAAGATQRGDLKGAAKLYDDAWSKVEYIGPAADVEAKQTKTGLATVRMELARQAQGRNDLTEALTQVNDVLRVDPQNAVAINYQFTLKKLLDAQQGRTPSKEVLDQIPKIQKERVDAATLVQDGRLLYELGELNEADAKLEQALVQDPSNQAALYYLGVVKDAQNRRDLSRAEVLKQEQIVKIDRAWPSAIKRDPLPVPNPAAQSTLIHTGTGRQAIVSKLERIRLDNVNQYENGLPLGEVIRSLNEQVKQRDPEKKGINFIINQNVDSAAPGGIAVGAPGSPDAGVPAGVLAPSAGPVDIMKDITITINPPLSDIRLADLLDIIVKVADKPIKYSIEDYGIIFARKADEPEQLYLRQYKVDPNTFYQGLESVSSITFVGNISTSSGGGSGGGGGNSGGGGGGGNSGGGFGGGGGNNSGGGGGNSGGGGGGGGGSISIPRVNVAGGGFGGGGGGFGGAAGAGAGAGPGGAGAAAGGSPFGGAGLQYTTVNNRMELVSQAVRTFFTTLGVNLSTAPGRSVFWNDRKGELLVRATMQELDIIEKAIEVLNIAPPQVNIKVKFVEVSQNDTKALGFNWYLGNFLMNNKSIIGSAGTAPSFIGAPTPANPSGAFPGNPNFGTTLPVSASDQLITAGLRNTANAPALATLTGILTDPQFRVVLSALEQRDGADLLNQAEATTLSGRQTHMEVSDLQTIVLSVNLPQTATGGTGVAGTGGLGTTAGGGAVASAVTYNTQIFPFGPVLDVVPYVSADGYTVQMTLIPALTEFVGYDNPGQFVPQAQSVSGSGSAAIPLVAVLPLPRFRLRQVTTTVAVWDGQTVVLGGLITENNTRYKDKVPVLGDLPLVGRLFQSQGNTTQKKNLVIFVTPTILDPAGNRYNTEEDLPFAQYSFPAQPKPPVVPNP